MPVTIYSNLLSVNAQRRLTGATTSLSEGFERLASGQRINRASDDAAGLSVSTSLKLDTRIYSQAMRNVSDGISALSIAEGAVHELSNITTRQIELAEQSANGVYTLRQRQSLDKEADALSDEFNRIIATTKFNGRRLFDLSERGELRIQAGYGENNSLSVILGDSLSRVVGTGSFTEAASFSSRYKNTSEQRGVAVGDVDGNGTADIAVSGFYDGAGGGGGFFAIQLNNGDGSFTAGASYTTHSNMGWGCATDIALADLNGDGALDVAVTGQADSNSTDSVAVYLNENDGSGTFTFQRTYLADAGTSTYGIAAVDVNKDGASDLVTTGEYVTGGKTYGYTGVYLNNGSGSFTGVHTYTMQGLGLEGQNYDVQAGDINGDGTSDLLVSGTVTHFVISADAMSYVYLNDGSGQFSLSSRYITAQGALQYCRSQGGSLADVNGDGALDMVNAVFAGGPNYSKVSVLLNDGSGGFSSQADYAAADWGEVKTVSAADVNGDGAVDILAGGQQENETEDLVATAFFYLNDGKGGFSPARTFESQLSMAGASSLTNSMALADMNGDSVADAVFAGLDGDGWGQANIFLSGTESTLTVQRQDLNTQHTARLSLADLQKQLGRISAELGAIGANLRRFEAAGNVLGTSRENYRAADSRISDVDIADASARLTKDQILQQTSTFVLQHANLAPQIALKLLAS